MGEIPLWMWITGVVLVVTVGVVVLAHLIDKHGR